VSRSPAVLLVDDEANILSALRRCLRREGYEILTAGSAAEALALLRARDVDLIVSDQKMPGMSGLDLLREVAARFAGVRRVLLTGWPEEIPDAELQPIGLTALLPKPWDDAELKAILRGQLGAAPGA
jgi:CheY-like chemotaxis protein